MAKDATGDIGADISTPPVKLTAKDEFYKELTTILKVVQPKVPDLVKRIEQFLDTKSRDMYEKLKKEMQQQVNYMIAKILYDVQVINREEFDSVIRAPGGRTASPPVNIQNPSSDVLGNFGDIPPPIM